MMFGSVFFIFFFCRCAVWVRIASGNDDPQHIALSTYYSNTFEDNDVTTNAEEAAEATKKGYKYSNANGYIYASQVAGSLPLQRYNRSSPSVDTLLVASSEGIAYAKANGFTFVRTDGYVLTTNTSAICTAPLKACLPLQQYYSSGRHDNFLVGSETSRTNAEDAQYQMLRVEGYQPPSVAPPPPPPPGWTLWPNTPPESIPFPKSKAILSFEFNSGSNANYGGADTWYPTWAADGNMYTPWTDGCVVDSITSEKICSGSGEHNGGNSTTGYATVIGDDPFNLTVTNVSVFTSKTLPYQGRYPCGSLFYEGVWFYGTYDLDNPTFPPNPEPNCGNWCVQGPFVDFRYSRDRGATWTELRIEQRNGSDNLFGETAMNNSKVKFGAPHVVDFGQELEHSPDGKVYIIGHGATRPEAHQSWMQGDQVYMARSLPTVEAMMDGAQWEFYSGKDSTGIDVWTTGDVGRAMPLITWNNHTGVVTMTYMPGLKKYIMVVSTPTYTPYTTKQFDTYFLESDSITGPFSYISYLSEFGPQAYFVHFPSKFLDSKPTKTNVTSGGEAMVMHGFLSYSANFAFHDTPNPPGSGYHWSLQEMRLVLGEKTSFD